MGMMENRKKKMICTALIALNLTVIWGNSLVKGENSDQMSSAILTWVNSFLGLDEAGAATLHYLIRKMAHFTEFACLGSLLAWHCRLSGETHPVIYPALLAMAAAVTDESIQLFTPDREPSLTDVWIDTSGAVTGIMLLLLGHHLMKKNILRNIFGGNNNEEDDFSAAGAGHGFVSGCLRRK